MLETYIMLLWSTFFFPLILPKTLIGCAGNRITVLQIKNKGCGLAEPISPGRGGGPRAGLCLLCPTLVAPSQIFIQKTIRKMVCRGKKLNIDY